VGVMRLILMPIDTCKTVLQVDSFDGFQHLWKRVVRERKFSVLYSGSIATAFSSIIGHYPWFFVYNSLNNDQFWLSQLLFEYIPTPLLRNAFIGLVSSIVSDTIVNVFRVIKTTKQSMGSKHDYSYKQTIQMIVASDGYSGLFGRGLSTRILANAFQSVLFTVIWRGLVGYLANGSKDGGGGGGGDGSGGSIRGGAGERTDGYQVLVSVAGEQQQQQQQQEEEVQYDHNGHHHNSEHRR
jgi:hypothetical protein